MKFGSLRALLNGAIALVLAACGGGGDGGIGGTGVAGNDISIGGITAFGSVWVNGVEFKSNTATIKIDDTVHPESDLKVGMVARVKGSIANAQADEISVSSAAKGIVESVSANQMVVMGQTVLVDAGTTVSNGPIAVGDFAEVHGVVTGPGQIAATFIEKKPGGGLQLPQPRFAVKGIVAGHNTTTNAFTIGALNVVMGTSPTLNDMPAGTWNGLQVEVKGTACSGSPPNGCGTLTASKVEPHTPRGDVAQIEIEGIVASGTSAAFNIGSQAVDASNATFVDGIAADLVPGTKVEVEGSLVGGVLKATKVSFRENVRFEATIASITGATTFKLQGLPTITIDTNAVTRYSGSATSFANLAANQNVRVRGRPGLNNTVVATEVEVRSGSSTDVRFQAIVTSAVSPNLTMLGVTIDTSSMQFRDLNDVAITQAQFFAAIAGGNKLVKVRGTLVGGTTINWNREAELED